MRQVETVRGLREYLSPLKQAGKAVGFVPTMGYLHDGHMSLMRHGRARCDVLVASIFVNPTQFGPNEDFAAYPRDVERDLRMLSEAQVDCVFLPGVDEIYPQGYRTYVQVEKMSDVLCGTQRPGHFRGVTTVVNKLFNAVMPDTAWFGEKDAQQLIIIQKMVTDLCMSVRVEGVPTVREADGLAMSSRNVYLSAEERAQAPVLYRALQAARAAVLGGERRAGAVLDGVRQALAAAPLGRLEYVEAVDARTLDALETLAGRVLLAMAVRFGRARLIDNVMFEVA